VALIPFLFKFLAGPLSDRVNLFGLGHRKPYILLGLLTQTAGLVGLSLVDPGRSLAGFTTLALLAVGGMALYDTCCDGMVIDVTPEDDRDRVQGSLVAARAIAAMVCSYGFGLWLEGSTPGAGSQRWLLWACAGFGLLPLVLGLLVREPRRGDDAEAFNWGAFLVLVRPRALVLLAFGVMTSIVGYGVEINLSPYYHALQFPAGAVGGFAALRYVGRAAGGALLPLAARRVDRPWLVALGVLALAATTAGQAAVGGAGSAAALGFAFGAANGWSDAVFYVLAMEASDPRMAASTYALFMAVTNVSVVGGSLFTQVDAALGNRFRPTFLVAALAVTAALVLVPPLGRPDRPKESGG
jgi:PAT family beta-lactamase induction signal transducer AmpG